MESEVKFVRLKNGDDVISEVEEHFKESDKYDTGYHYYTLVKPLKIMYLPNPRTGGLNLAFAHWVSPMLSPTQEFMVNASEVLTMSETSESMLDNYTKSLEVAARDESEEDSSLEDLGLDLSDKLPMDQDTLDAVREFLEEAKALEKSERIKQDLKAVKKTKGH